jgi:hypothetical protein
VTTAELPQGYVRSDVAGVEIVGLHWAAAALAQAVQAHGTLFDWAAAQPVRHPLRGRGVTWATEIAAGIGDGDVTPVVVRHSQHGGALRALTGDLFARPTRAPIELSASVQLAARGVLTPEVVGYAVYPTLGALARSDVMTRRLPAGHDFPEAWAANTTPQVRDAIITAVAELLRALTKAGAHHPDLNVKNVYIAGDGAACLAYVLDVDRVVFDDGGDVAARNFARFARSARKWNDQHALGVGDDALVRLAALAWVST